MRRLAVVALFLCLSVSYAQATVLFSENWDDARYTSNWSLQCDTDCNAIDGPGVCPDGVFGLFSPWTWGGAGSPSCADASKVEITSSAAYGGSGKGFRLNIDPDSVCVTYENYIGTNAVFSSNYNVYLRWYFRANFNHQTSYKKLFRLTGNNFIVDLYNMTGGTRFTLFTAADGWDGYGTPIVGWSLENNYTPNTWICVELFIDQTHDQVTWWIDGVQYNTSSFAASNYAINSIKVGGNQCGNGYIGSTPIGTDAIVDYDNLVMSDSYIGPEGGDTTTPDPSFTTSSPQTIAVDSLTVAGTAYDAVWGGGSACKWRVNGEPGVSVGTLISGLTYSGTVNWSVATSGYSIGANTLYVECGDDAANWSTGHSITVYYDPSPRLISNVTLSNSLPRQ